jgi:plastocyanin
MNRPAIPGVPVSVGIVRRWATAVGVAALLGVITPGILSGCTSEEAEGPVITIKNSTFGGDLTVEAGAEVTVRNDDTIAHILNAVDDSFTSPNLEPGGSGEFYAPYAPGEYQIGCTYHPEMKATLIVVAPTSTERP